MDKNFKVPEFITEYSFEDIRPFYDGEAKEVLQRIVANPLFYKLIHYLWPEMTKEEVAEKVNRVNSNLDFQLEFMHKAIRTIVSRSSSGLTFSGIEHLDRNDAYLFVANHRDILLDSAILQIILVENNFSTSEITFGNNLMEDGFITDFGRLNRMFKVEREGTSKELYEISKKLSAYVRHTIVNKKTSAWIAQRNGRTKDGIDLTQTGLLKMLNLSGSNSFDNNFKQLKIVPLTISYEYEPCDVLKTRELYLSSLHSKYQKAPGEDLNSILTGINQPKGRIHLSFGKPILEDLNYDSESINENEKVKCLSALIDQRIHTNYKLWPVNYIAADLLGETSKYSSKYSEQEKLEFVKYASESVAKTGFSEDSIHQLFLKIYANPVISKNQYC